MSHYLDTSIAVAVLMGEPATRQWFEHAVSNGGVVSSRLLQTELTRVLRREDQPVSDRDLVLQHVALAPITDAVLAVAEAIPQHVRTLDAIHIATALQLGGKAIVTSHDRQMLDVAESLGLRTVDPMELTDD